jgi:hypothetical protein
MAIEKVLDCLKDQRVIFNNYNPCHNSSRFIFTAIFIEGYGPDHISRKPFYCNENIKNSSPQDPQPENQAVVAANARQ